MMKDITNGYGKIAKVRKALQGDTDCGYNDFKK